MVESISCPHCSGLINISLTLEAVSVIHAVSAKAARARLKSTPVYKRYESHPIRPITDTDRRIIKYHDKKGWTMITPERLAKNLGVGRMQVAGYMAHIHNRIR